MTQRHRERPPIEVQHPLEHTLARMVDPSVRPSAFGAQQHGAHHRRRRQRNHQRDHDRNRDRHGEFAEQLADQAAHQQDRDKHRDQRHAHRQHREADLPGSDEGGLQRRLSHVEMTGNVLQHHNGVVDHEPGRDRQRHQREDVEAVSEQIHHREGRDQRHRYRHHRNQRRPAAAQEREHDQDHQDHGNDQRDFDVEQRGPDRDGAVDREIDIHRRRDRRTQNRHQRLHPFDHPDDVGARLPVHDHHDRELAVGEAQIAQILHRIEHVADIGQAHRRAVAIGNHQRFVVLGLDRLIVGIELVALAADVDASLRTVGIGAAERGANIFQPDPEFIERRRLEFDAHGGQRSAADADFADALDLRQLLRQHGGRGVIQFGRGQRIRRQRIDQDRRRGGVELAIAGIAAQRGRQVGARGVDRGLDVARGAIDVATDAELQVDARGAERTRRGHLADIGDLAEMTLQRTGHRGCHVRRARARQGRLHRNGRNIDVRQRRDRQLEKGDSTGDNQPERQQSGGDGPTDRRAGKTHA